MCIRARCRSRAAQPVKAFVSAPSAPLPRLCLKEDMQRLDSAHKGYKIPQYVAIKVGYTKLINTIMERVFSKHIL